MKAWKSDPACEAKYNAAKTKKKTWAILQDFMFFLYIFPSSPLPSLLTKYY